MELEKTYTAVYSAAQKGLGTFREIHIAELYREPGYGWLSKGLTLCDVNAERDNGRIVAAQGKGKEDATCRVCKFTYGGIVKAKQAASRPKGRPPMPSARRRETAKNKTTEKPTPVQ